LPHHNSIAWIDVMTVVDVAHHFGEAEHVIRLLSPDRAYP